MNREDYLRPIRALLREIVRVLRHDINISALCRGLMLDRKDSAPQFRDFEFKASVTQVYFTVSDILYMLVCKHNVSVLYRQ
jgi:integrator complex subunit 1